MQEACVLGHSRPVRLTVLAITESDARGSTTNNVQGQDVRPIGDPMPVLDHFVGHLKRTEPLAQATASFSFLIPEVSSGFRVTEDRFLWFKLQ